MSGYWPDNYWNGGGGGSCDYPAQSDVRRGVVYADGGLVGTLFFAGGGGGDGTTDLLHSPANVLAQLLVDMGQGTAPEESDAWPVYTAKEPNLPDNCITCYDTSPREDGRVHTDGERQEHQGVQVRVRARTHPAGYAKIRALATALDQYVYQALVSLDGAEYLLWSVSRTGGILSLGVDSPNTRRVLFTLNAVLTVRLVSAPP